MMEFGRLHSHGDSDHLARALSRSMAIAEFAMDGTILHANENFLNIMGFSIAEVLGRHHRIFLDAEDSQSTEYRDFWLKLRSGEFCQAEFRRLRKDRQEVWLQATYNPVIGADGQLTSIIKIATDITDIRQRDADRQSILTAISRSAALIEFALDGTIIAANENYLKIIEYEANDIIGQHHRIFVEPRYAASDQYLSFWAGLRGGKFQNAEYRRLTGSGRDIWLQASYNPILDAAGRPVRIMKIATDITDMVVAREENRRLAFVDGLTGIGNRRSFDEAIRDEMRRAGRTGAPLSLLMLDVDYFKLFNDHHGHQEGDTCLKAIADTIRRFARRPGDLAARYGGEEFAILLPQTPAAEALELADEVRKAVRKLDVMHCGLTPCGVTTVSIGCATSRVETAASEHASSDLIASADAALYKAKTAGRDCVRTDDISGPDTAVDDILSAYHAAR